MAWQICDEQIQPLPGVQIIFVAVLGDLDAAHQFHDEVRPAGFRRRRIQHTRDVWMVHHRQRLPLGLKAGDDVLGVHAQLDDLERHAPPDRLLLFGHENHAAAAFADFLQQFIMADARSKAFGERKFCIRSLAAFVRFFLRSVPPVSQKANCGTLAHR